MGRPKGTGGRYIYTKPPAEKAGSVSLFIGRGVWYDAGSPARINLLRKANEPNILYLEPCDTPEGYKVSQSSGRGIEQFGMPKIAISIQVWRDAAFPIGRFAAKATNGTIVVDLTTIVEKGHRV